MARTSLIACWLVFVALLATPVFAQSVFDDAPPRPPADVPNMPPAPPPPVYYPNPPPRTYPGDDSVRPPGAVRTDQPPPQPLPAPMSLPPANRPGGGNIQSQPLAPPPGTAPQPQATTPPPAAPPQGAAAPVPTLPGLPPGVRQPPGTPPKQQSGAPEPGDEIVVEPPPQRISNPTAVFSGLDKITGRIISFDVAINETVQFGALQVTPRVCYSRPPTETPNTDAFVEVDEVTLQGEIKRIFTGWMFAASPGLHAVEHPIYDVWLTDCKGGKNPAVADVTPDDEAQAKAPPTNAKPAAKKPAAKKPVQSQRGALPPIR